MMKVINYQPDVIHCNDWQTGLIPTYLKVLYGQDGVGHSCSSIVWVNWLGVGGGIKDKAQRLIENPREEDAGDRAAKAMLRSYQNNPEGHNVNFKEIDAEVKKQSKGGKKKVWKKARKS